MSNAILVQEPTEPESLCALIEQLSDCAFLHRASRLVHVNQPCLDMLGFDDPREVIGRPVRDLLHPDDWWVFESRLAQVQATGQAVNHVEERFCDRAGRSIWCDVAEVPVTSTGGPGVVTIARRRHGEVGPEDSAHFADRMAMIETLAGGVAHGINNPLSYVKSNVAFTVAAIDTLLEETWNESTTRCLQEVRHVLEIAEEGADRIAGIVSDLLAFSRRHDHKGPRHGVDLHELLDAVVRLNTHAFPGRVHLEASLGPVPRVDGEAAALAQVFANIVQNAVQSRREVEGEAHIVTICTWTDPTSGWALVAVRDRGEGMESDVLRRVFEPFFTTREVGEGSGLGLPVAMGIVHSMGGHIDIESKPGRGTCVRVALPARGRRLDSSSPRRIQEA